MVSLRPRRSPSEAVVFVDAGMGGAAFRANGTGCDPRPRRARTCLLPVPSTWRAADPAVAYGLARPWRALGARRLGLYANHQWLANRGYAVLSVNYRGSTGFGKSFVNAANLEWAGKMHDDLSMPSIGRSRKGSRQAGRDHGRQLWRLRDLGRRDDHAREIRLRVDLVGISNLVTFLNTIPEYWLTWKSLWKVRVGDYTTDAGLRFLAERSPLNRANQIVRPLLIGQGANDVRVKASESEQIVAAIQHTGRP